MIIVYHCYGGAHTSISAANIHLGRLPRHRRPAWRAIATQPYFDWLPGREIGRLIRMGTDAAGREVYCIGFGAGKTGLAHAILTCLRYLGGDTERLRLVDALPAANWPLRIGGFLSRQLGLVRIGRPLAVLGVRLSYPRLLGIAAAGRKP